MAKLDKATTEMMSDYFVNYLFQKYNGSRHVRRVASWVGLILTGVEKIAGNNWSVPHQRQIAFRLNGKKYKVRFNHKVGSRGGVEIVEALPNQGSPDGHLVASIGSFVDAQSFCANAKALPW